MTDVTNYKVVGECAHVKVDGGLRLAYKGAPVPDGQDPKRLEHLLSTGLIAKVDDADLAPNAAVVADEFATTGGQRVKPEVDSEQEQKRAAAKAKLPTDGSAPDGRASHEVWVEYAVSKGLSREESEKASKDDLKAALAQK